MASPTAAGEIVPAESAPRLSVTARNGAVILGTVAVALCFVRFGFSGHALIGALFTAALVYLAVFDLEHRLIPNRVVLPATAVVLAAQIAVYPGRSVEWIAA